MTDNLRNWEAERRLGKLAPSNTEWQARIEKRLVGVEQALALAQEVQTLRRTNEELAAALESTKQALRIAIRTGAQIKQNFRADLDQVRDRLAELYELIADD